MACIRPNAPCTEVGWRLDVGCGAKDDPRHGDGPQMILEGRLGRIRHAGVRLSPEVLDDHFLDMPELTMERAQSKQHVGPLAARLADTDQNA